MKFSTQWLTNYVDIKVPVAKLAEQLTSIGFEVESVAGDIIEIAVPPNRGDCLSIVGIAREIAVVNDASLIELNFSKVATKITDELQITVDAPEICPQYYGRILRNINPLAKTPEWMVKCLQDCGLNTISAVVDVTNYVMLELGQPMHAFDLDKINNNIVVRTALADEKITLLDDRQLELLTDSLVIADANVPLALAGIMGGKDSAVTTDTQNLFIECAIFSPIATRLTARKYNLITDSSYRFERHVDCNITELAMHRVTQLLVSIVGGDVAPITTYVNSERLSSNKQIILKQAKINKILGMSPDDGQVRRILSQLAMSVHSIEDGWEVSVPTFRADITRDIDLVEEIARHVGYDNIPIHALSGKLSFKAHPEAKLGVNSFKQCLVHRGYHEAICYSFIDPKLLELFFPGTQGFKLDNPISEEMSVMRSSLLPSLVCALQYNQHRQNMRVRLFEVGLRFYVHTDGELKQQKMLAGVCVGSYLPMHWSRSEHVLDFFDLKSDVESLFKLSNLEQIKFEQASHPAMHPGQCAAIMQGAEQIGSMGALHPRLAKHLDLQNAYVFELDYESLANGNIAEFCHISRHPSIRRDLALVVDIAMPAQTLLQVIKNTAGDNLQDVQIFDVYQGKNIEDNKKSIGICMVLQHASRTLVDEEVNAIMDKIIDRVKNECNAILRS